MSKEEKAKELYPDIERMKWMDDVFWREATTEISIRRECFLKGVEFAQQQTPHSSEVELPTDEQIEKWVNEHGYYGHCTTEYHEGLEEGAKWMRSKSTNQDKVREVLNEVAELYPYKEQGNRDSYSQYNEGWQDAIASIESRLNSKKH